MDFEECLTTIWRNYPRWPSTFGRCRRVDCDGSHSARGSKVCAKCAEGDLADIVGEDLAEQYHESIRGVRQIESVMAEKAFQQRLSP